MDYYTYDEYLYHWGVKGMKWGVRRYQNKDGSLTSDGKKRLNEYKTRETAEAIKRGTRFKNKHEATVVKLKNQMKTQKESGDAAGYSKTKTNYDKAKARLKRAKDITSAELKKIKNMTFDEMRSEKMKSAIEVGIYATGIALPLPLSDVLAIAMVGDPFDNKTKRRTGKSYYG